MGPGAGIVVHASAGAVKTEAAAQKVLEETEAAAKQAQEDPGADKTKLRNLKKKSMMYVLQISATQKMVNSRTQAILEMLAQCTPGERAYGVLQLADRLVAQCEALVGVPSPLRSLFVAFAEPDAPPLMAACPADNMFLLPRLLQLINA